MPAGLTTIRASAFYACTGLKQLTLPAGLIGAYAFAGCGGPTQLIVPAGLTTIGEGAFAGCTALTGGAIDTDQDQEYHRIKHSLIPLRLQSQVLPQVWFSEIKRRQNTFLRDMAERATNCLT